MLSISRILVNRIIQQAQEQLPIECCGILAGTVDSDTTKITEVYPMTNVDRSPEHFSLDPREQFDVYYSIRDKELKMLGNYHSHPSTPARPSLEDIRLAYDTEAIYVIVSLLEQPPVLKGFRIQMGQYTEIPLVIND
ncbi:MAG: M67 family metallopeptidase [Firmicutes bacterium]|nr:M67 family metallopeptidase [Bacillota bacterium]